VNGGAAAVALLLEANPTASVAEVTKTLLERTTKGVLSGLPPGTPNRLLFVGDIRPLLAGSTHFPLESVNYDGGSLVYRIKARAQGAEDARLKVSVTGFRTVDKDYL
jgi:hypothetical protein